LFVCLFDWLFACLLACLLVCLFVSCSSSSIKRVVLMISWNKERAQEIEEQLKTTCVSSLRESLLHRWRQLAGSFSWPSNQWCKTAKRQKIFLFATAHRWLVNTIKSRQSFAKSSTTFFRVRASKTFSAARVRS
jgi:hypothetical protein